MSNINRCKAIIAIIVNKGSVLLITLQQYQWFQAYLQ